jgi:hypothetical protein
MLLEYIARIFIVRLPPSYVVICSLFLSPPVLLTIAIQALHSTSEKANVLQKLQARITVREQVRQEHFRQNTFNLEICAPIRRLGHFCMCRIFWWYILTTDIIYVIFLTGFSDVWYCNYSHRQSTRVSLPLQYTLYLAHPLPYDNLFPTACLLACVVSVWRHNYSHPQTTLVSLPMGLCNSRGSQGAAQGANLSEMPGRCWNNNNIY